MRPTLRLVIGLLCAGVVLIVAIVTLAITYSVSLTTVRDIGKKHAVALATTARVQTTEYFDIPTRHLDTVAAMHLLNNMDMPSNLPEAEQLNPAQHVKLFYAMYGMQKTVNFSYTALGCIYEDGSGNSVYINEGLWVRYISRFVRNWPAGDMIAYLREVWLSNFTEYTQGTIIQNLWGQFAAYATAKLVAGRDRNGLWYTVSLYEVGGAVNFMFPAAKPIYNKTGSFIGFVSLGRPLGKISDFLNGVKGTKNTQVFAIDSDGRLIGSTHATPFFTVREVTLGTALQKGCATSADTAYSDNNNREYHGCRTLASAFSAYPPLVAVAANDQFLRTRGTEVNAITVGGSNYFVVSTSVPNSYRLWGVNVILCMPEADILGDIVKGRNTAIGVTAGVFIAAAIMSFALVYALLQPLSTVSQRMLDTARLRDTEDERSYSRLAEICDLQKAYTNMNTAIKSFTRYVPRDVVKDLMASGQLCTIQMESKMCTMLFVDIAGFTTICERVPPDQLSELVSQYFDRASRIVMDHDGLIDKFIGDCIMAVWGAPFAVAHQEVKAVLTGVLINRETCVEPLSKSWDEAGEQLRVRVGISTGEVLAGNMGSADRMNYTVIGDPVNLAARLESMNKQFDTRVMVSEMTAEGLGGAFVLRLLMPIAVVGKDKPVKVYEVVGLPTQMDTVFDLRASDEANTPAGSMESADVFALSLPDSPLGLTATPTGFDSRRRSAYAGSRRGHRNAVELLQHARTVSVAGPPEGRLVLTAAEVESAALHSAAVTAFLAKMFDECLVLLERSTGGASGNGGVFPQHEKSVSLRSGDDSYVSHGGLSLADMSAPFASIRTPTSTSPARHAFSVTTLAPTNDPSLEPLAAADTFALHAGPFAIEDIEDDEAGQRTVSMRGPSPRGDGAEFTGRGTAVRRLSIASFNPGSTAARLLRRECLRCAASCPDDFTGVFRALEK